MKTLLILRHAKSSWADADLSDHDRPLNARGQRDAPRIGQLLAELGLRPNLVLSSTALRARKTASAVIEASGWDIGLRLVGELYHASPDEHAEVLWQQDDSHDCLLIVAHNPGVEELTATLTGEHETFTTAALAQVELPIGRWSELTLTPRGTLRGMWRPKELD